MFHKWNNSKVREVNHMIYSWPLDNTGVRWHQPTVHSKSPNITSDWICIPAILHPRIQPTSDGVVL